VLLGVVVPAEGVHHGFGDKAGLALALLDERERALQEQIISGSSPLGPVGESPPAPVDRLVAFVEAYLDYALSHLDLVRMSETASPGARYRIGAYRFWHRHIALLLAAARPDADADALAHVLLASLAAEHLYATTADLDPGRVRAATVEAARALCGPHADPGSHG